jgi:hypothetical protein
MTRRASIDELLPQQRHTSVTPGDLYQLAALIAHYDSGLLERQPHRTG